MNPIFNALRQKLHYDENGNLDYITYGPDANGNMKTITAMEAMEMAGLAAMLAGIFGHLSFGVDGADNPAVMGPDGLPASWLALHGRDHQALGMGVPSAFTSRALTGADKSKHLICATAQVATVDAGLGAGFSCSFRGTISFDGEGTATLNDVRTTGAILPWCTLMQTGADAYDIVGNKVE